MHQFFLIVHVLAAVGLVTLVLLQHGRGADAGAAFGSGSSGTLFGARGPASFLTRITAILAAVFFLTSISLAYIVSHSDKRESVIQKLGGGNAPPAQEETISIPPAPVSGAGSSGSSKEPNIPAAPVAGSQTAGSSQSSTEPAPGPVNPEEPKDAPE